MLHVFKVSKSYNGTTLTPTSDTGVLAESEASTSPPAALTFPLSVATCSTVVSSTDIVSADASSVTFPSALTAPKVKDNAKITNNIPRIDFVFILSHKNFS